MISRFNWDYEHPITTTTKLSTEAGDNPSFAWELIVVEANPSWVPCQPFDTEAEAKQMVKLLSPNRQQSQSAHVAPAKLFNIHHSNAFTLAPGALRLAQASGL